MKLAEKGQPDLFETGRITRKQMGVETVGGYEGLSLGAACHS